MISELKNTQQLWARFDKIFFSRTPRDIKLTLISNTPQNKEKLRSQ